jgi:hypothetical protein
MVVILKFATLWVKIKNLPRKYTISAAVFISVFMLYGIIFFTPKHVTFSYAEVPCVNQLTLLPDLHKSTDTMYEVRPAGSIKIGPLAVAARKMCFLPTQPPVEGVIKVSTAPFGGWVMRKTFAITADSPPAIDTSVFKNPVPASRPLRIPLGSTDRLFQYSLQVRKKTQVKCSAEDAAMSCDVGRLKLTQGKPYDVKIIRQFGGQRQAETVAKEKLTTLPATRVTETSIKPGEVVYTKPKVVNLAFDKKIAAIDHTLYRLEDGDKRTPIKTTIVIDGGKVQIKAAKDLPRSAKFELIVGVVQATDGSGLEEPYVLSFETSGGPRVTGINVGSTGIPVGATATITFDQPLSEEQDIGEAISVSGGAVVSGRDERQVYISLAGVPKCGDFAIRINNDLQSNYGVTGNTAWEHSGRMICHTVSTIGYSHQGRPINAYYFGGGAISIVYTGAIHGSEISSRDLMHQWIDYLEANARSIPSDKTVVVVPQINPDGVASGSRVNARNVDLNRNFATSDWQKDVTTVDSQPFPGGGGEMPMSEPETQAIAALIQQLRPALVLSYHSIGGLIIGNQAGFSSSKAATYSQLSGYYNATGQSNPFEYSASGTADDWYAQKLGVPSLLIELGSHTYHQFGRNQSAMWTMLQ